jgi:hypothetical protein
MGKRWGKEGKFGEDVGRREKVEERRRKVREDGLRWRRLGNGGER